MMDPSMYLAIFALFALFMFLTTGAALARTKIISPEVPLSQSKAQEILDGIEGGTAAPRMRTASPGRVAVDDVCSYTLEIPHLPDDVDQVLEPTPYMQTVGVRVNGELTGRVTGHQWAVIPADLLRGGQTVRISGLLTAGRDRPPLEAVDLREGVSFDGSLELREDPTLNDSEAAHVFSFEHPTEDPTLRGLDAEIADLEARWNAYDTDLAAILDRPLLRDLSDPRVEAVVRARAKIRRHTSSTPQPKREEDIDAFAAALDAAERAADARGGGALPADEREHVERARDLLRVIESAASSETERALAYGRLRAAVASMGHLAIAPEKLPLLLPAGAVHALGRSFDPRAATVRERVS